MSRRAADIWLLVIVAIWGITFVTIKDVTDRWPKHALAFNAIRFWVATLAFLPFLGGRQKCQHDWPAGILAGLALFAGYGLQTEGLARTTPATAGFITGLYAVLVPIGAWWLGRRVGWPAWLGIALAACGLVLLSLREDLTVGHGEMLVAGCAVSFAVQILVVDRYAKHVDPIRFTMIQCLVTAIGASLYTTSFELPAHGWPELTNSVLLAAGFCGLFATTFAFFIQTKAQQSTPASHVAVIFAAEPVFAALASWIWTHEPFTSRMLLGCALILAGMLCAEFGDRLISLLRRIPRFRA